MGKVKSAIITALLVAVILVLAFFATISFNVPGSNRVSRYNSFMSSIPLGSDLTGDATTVLYPEGVITEADYDRDVYENEEKQEEYEEKYQYVDGLGLYVEKDKLGEDNGEAFLESIKADAEILSDRFAQKGYGSYTVSVVNGYTIRVTVPSGLSYAAYKSYNTNERSDALTAISNAMRVLSYEGSLSLRSGETFDENNSLYFEKEENEFNCFIKGASVFHQGATYAVRIDLTDAGLEKINTILTQDSSATTAYLYVGESNLRLQFSMGEALTDNTLLFQTAENYAQDYAIIVESVAHGNMLTNKYGGSGGGSFGVLATTASMGENAAIFAGIVALVLIVIAAVCPIIKYKKLGIVNALMVLTYSVALVTALLVISLESAIQLTLAGILVGVLGLALLSFANFYTFEAVRRETEVGRTISASVTLGYKKTMFAVIDIHAVLVIASAVMALVGVGELATCGIVLLVATIASFVLYWFTRFMWYVLSSPVRDKFAFCGYVREVEDDD